MEDIFKDLENFKEDPKTAELITELKDVKRRGYLTKDEFFKIGMWKSPRPKNLYLKNTENDVKDITKFAFNCSDEKLKLLSLTKLIGISIPAASAILTLTDPQNYGIIDIRVWLTLYRYGLVKTQPKGIGLSVNNWVEYLLILRPLASKYNTSCRIIELMIFDHHKTVLQEGNLYKNIIKRIT